MPRDIIKAFKTISHQWLSDLKGYDETRLYHKPSNSEWSLAELYDHIIKVARTYQVPNFYKCIHKHNESGKSKNIKGYLVFNLNIIPYRKIKISSFPKELQNSFAPEIQKQDELITNFEGFIDDIITVGDLLKTANVSLKHNHPFFGMINSREWFSLVEIHMGHHNRQKLSIEKLKL